MSGGLGTTVLAATSEGGGAALDQDALLRQVRESQGRPKGPVRVHRAPASKPLADPSSPLTAPHVGGEATTSGLGEGEAAPKKRRRRRRKPGEGGAPDASTAP